MSRSKLAIASLSLWLVSLSNSQSRGGMVSIEAVADGVFTRRTDTPPPWQGFPSITAQLDNGAVTLSSRSSFTRFGLNSTETVVWSALEFSFAPWSGATILSAHLQFTENIDGSPTLGNHPLYGYAGDGAITQGDFSLTHDVLSDQIADGFVQQSFVSFDVTEFVLANAQNPYLGFMIGTSGGMASSFPGGGVVTVGNYEIHGRLASNPDLRPHLVLEVVPELNSLCLLATAGSCFAFVLRRRSHGS